MWFGMPEMANTTSGPSAGETPTSVNRDTQRERCRPARVRSEPVAWCCQTGGDWWTGGRPITRLSRLGRGGRSDRFGDGRGDLAVGHRRDDESVVQIGSLAVSVIARAAAILHLLVDPRGARVENSLRAPRGLGRGNAAVAAGKLIRNKYGVELGVLDSARDRMSCTVTVGSRSAFRFIALFGSSSWRWDRYAQQS